MIRRSTPLGLSILTIFTFIGATPAAGDPRWFQHARRITDGAAPTARPDVSFVFGEGAGGAGLLAVVYEQTDSLRGDQDIYLKFSSDYGCTFCPPKLWVGSTNDETRPRVEVGVISFQYLSIHVVFERGGEVLVAYDATIDTRSAVPICDQLAALVPGLRTLSRPRGLGEFDSRPRIAKASNGTSFLQMHAVWQRLGVGAPSIEYANDLAGDGSAWTAPGRDLTPDIGGRGTLPDITGDAAAAAFGVGAVSVFFHASTGGVRMSRNNVSGVAGGWLAPSVEVSATAEPSGIAAESSSTGWGESAAWTGAVWRDSATNRVWFDAGLWSGNGLTLFPDFLPAADHALASLPAAPTGDLAVALGPARDGTERVELMAFWPTGASPQEILLRSGIMDPQIPPYRDLDVSGFTPERKSPPDAVVSTPLPFSMCAWNEMTGACDPLARNAGSSAGAGDVSVASISIFGNNATSAVVYTDDRSDPTPQVYLTLSDRRVDAPRALRAGTSCQALRTASALVSFETIAQCPDSTSFFPEFMERYLLYYTTSGLGGPYPDRVVLGAAGLPASASFTAANLSPSTRYDFVVIGEDQARNLNPASFDPGASNNTPAPTQSVKAVTPSCSPALALNSCSFVTASCGGVSDSTANPGDIVRMTVRLANSGDWAATAITGTVIATGATVITPIAGDLGGLGLSIPPFGTIDLTIEARLDLTCTPFGLALGNLHSDGGVVSFGRLDCPAPLLAVDCSSTCGASCLAASLTRPGTLLGVRTGTNGATFSWTIPGPDLAIEYHLNSVTSKLDLTDPGPRRPPIAGGRGTAECEAYPPNRACLDADAVPSLPAVRFYRVVGACGPLGTDEGPL